MLTKLSATPSDSETTRDRLYSVATEASIVWPRQAIIPALVKGGRDER